MKNIYFYYQLIKKGDKKGQLNTKEKKLRFTLRTLIFYPWVKNLTSFILKHDYLSSTIYEYPILASKIHRPYLSKSFTTEEKLNAIKDSYKFIDIHFSKEVKKLLYTKGKILLGKIPYKFFVATFIIL